MSMVLNDFVTKGPDYPKLRLQFTKLDVTQWVWSYLNSLIVEIPFTTIRIIVRWRRDRIKVKPIIYLKHYLLESHNK